MRGVSRTPDAEKLMTVVQADVRCDVIRLACMHGSATTASQEKPHTAGPSEELHLTAHLTSVTLSAIAKVNDHE